MFSLGTQCLSLSLGIANKIFRVVPQEINARGHCSAPTEFVFQHTKKSFIIIKRRVEAQNYSVNSSQK